MQKYLEMLVLTLVIACLALLLVACMPWVFLRPGRWIFDKVLSAMVACWSRLDRYEQGDPGQR